MDQKVPQIIELQTEIGYLKNKLKNKEFFYLEEKKNIVRFFLYICNEDVTTHVTFLPRN